MTEQAVPIERLTGDEAVEVSHSIVALYAAAFDATDAVRQSFAKNFVQCMREYAGAQTEVVWVDEHGEATTRGADGASIGAFSYGFTYERGHWWPEQVGPALEAAGLGEWQEDAFELVELAVRPDLQGRGLGSALLRELQQRAPQRRILLATNTDNPAQKTYRRNGFELLLPDFHYPVTNSPSLIFGWDRQSAR